MKILYFLDFPYGVGGASIVLLKQAFISKQRGHKVCVVIPSDINGQHAMEFDRMCQEFGLKVVTASYTVAICMENIDILASLDQYKAILVLLREYAPQLIHSTQLNIAVELAARELRIPHLMNIYQTDQETFKIKWMKIYPQYHSADSHFAVGRWEKGLNISSRCIRVPYETKIDNEDLSKPRDESQLFIVTAGTVCSRKNQMEILKFILECQKNGFKVHLTVLGRCDNEYGDRCKNFVKKNGLGASIIFTGFVLNVEEYLRKADVFILASTVESFPGVLVESMANKVPIISTAVAGVPELLKDGENGFLAMGYRAEDIYQAFLRYLEKREKGQIGQIIEKAYTTYLEQHTYVVTGEMLDDYYQWIVCEYQSKSDSHCLMAEDVRKEINVFLYEKALDHMDQFFMDHLWYIYHLVKVFEAGTKKVFVIWGAGFWGKIVLDWLCHLGMEGSLISFIDKNKQGKYLGYPVISPNEAVEADYNIILVSIADENVRLEIMEYLDGNGKIRNKDYFMVHNDPVRI